MSRQRKIVLWLVAIGVGAALLGFSLARFLQAPPAKTPVASTDFALPDLAGKTHGLADWHGKLVLLNFWATWCPPCRKEIPLFIDLQRRHAGAGLQIVGIAVDEPAAVASYAQHMRLNYPVLLGDDAVFDLMTAYGNSHGSLPYSVIIKPDGRILAVKVGAFGEKELDDLLQPLLVPAKMTPR